jgi:hypothetical protein
MSSNFDFFGHNFNYFYLEFFIFKKIHINSSHVNFLKKKLVNNFVYDILNMTVENY